MHDVTETQGKRGSLAEHGLLEMRLSGMIRAAGCEDIIFCILPMH